MHQLQLFEFARPKRIVNVSSVPKRSPFRYPGGKTWLIPEIRQWLSSKIVQPKLLLEPFAGGGIVGLTAAFERLASHVNLIELDPDVASVWKAILSEDGYWLAQRILDFELTTENADVALNSVPINNREKAFKTILRNRISHGGILAPGGGRLKSGENGRGITSRWYPQTLAYRIRAINEIRDRISFSEQDGIQTIRDHKDNADAVFFIDPPYTAAGKRAGRRLYTYCELDHEDLFDVCRNIKGDFLMTYDNADDVRQMAIARGFDVELISMKNTHHAEMSELLIGRDLSWLRM